MIEFDLEVCSYPRCRSESHIVGYIQGKQFALCRAHWDKHCAATDSPPTAAQQWIKGGPNGPIEEKIAKRRTQ